MEIYERILTKEEINKRFIRAVTAIMVNKLISSKTGLAESLGVKPAKFSEILNGRMNVGIDMIARMCDFYEVSPDWLLLSRGNNVFRRSPKQAIWIDDEDLDTNSKITEETAMENTAPLSPEQESIIYKMYKEKDEENKVLMKQIGCLEERIRQLESQNKESDSPTAASLVTEAFTSESYGDYGEDFSPTKQPTTSKRSSAGKT